MRRDRDDDDDRAFAEYLPGGRALNLLLLSLAAGGLAINLLLLWRHLRGGQIAGCGGASACDEMLSSQWSEVFGIPVTVFGALVYLGLIVSLLVPERPQLRRVLGIVLGAAIWFGFVQAVLVGRFCPWCMAAHSIGVCVVVLGLWREVRIDHTVSLWMTTGTMVVVVALGLGFAQRAKRRIPWYRIDELRALSPSQVSGIYARGDGRKVAFADGRRVFDVNALPHLGPPDARCVMVEYFDYQCPSCQVMRGFIDALLARHPADLCVVILPVPMERSCNSSLGATDAEFVGSCKLTRLSLVLWRTRPAAFAGFHRFLLGGATVDEATAKVLDTIAPGEMFAALRDPWIDELIQANVSDARAFSATSKKLPKVLVRGTRILHGLPSGEADFIRVMEQELGL
ncbi:MAG: vitamin K epoxide reductase family protein [Verrucomicrobiota bacterium]